MKTGLQKLLLLAAALSFAYYLVCGTAVRFDTAQLWLWPVISAGCLTLDALIALSHKTGWKLPAWAQGTLWTLFGLCAAAALCMMSMVAFHMNEHAPDDLDYLIVLGARVNGTSEADAVPSGALLHRAESAAAYVKNNPDTRIIASGGKGADEPITEAECIRRELIRLGVDEDHILMEEDSTTTHENMMFSRALIGENDAVAVVTNNFHTYRSQRLAETAFGRPVYAESAEFAWVLLPHYIVRESVCSVLDALDGYMTLWP